MISLGPPERWPAAGEPLMDFPRVGREEKIHLAASVDALQHDRASVSGTGVINGQQKQSWDVWPTLCGLFFYFRGGEVESCFLRRGLRGTEETLGTKTGGCC